MRRKKCRLCGKRVGTPCEQRGLCAEAHDFYKGTGLYHPVTCRHRWQRRGNCIAGKWQYKCKKCGTFEWFAIPPGDDRTTVIVIAVLVVFMAMYFLFFHL